MPFCVFTLEWLVSRFSKMNLRQKFQQLLKTEVYANVGGAMSVFCLLHLLMTFVVVLLRHTVD